MANRHESTKITESDKKEEFNAILPFGLVANRKCTITTRRKPHKIKRDY